jgi:hypothetical protein
MDCARDPGGSRRREDSPPAIGWRAGSDSLGHGGPSEEARSAGRPPRGPAAARAGRRAGGASMRSSRLAMSARPGPAESESALSGPSEWGGAAQPALEGGSATLSLRVAPSPCGLRALPAPSRARARLASFAGAARRSRSPEPPEISEASGASEMEGRRQAGRRAPYCRIRAACRLGLWALG